MVGETNDGYVRVTSVFMAAIEATEEDLVNSLFMAETMKGTKAKKKFPKEELLPYLKRK